MCSGIVKNTLFQRFFVKKANPVVEKFGRNTHPHTLHMRRTSESFSQFEYLAHSNCFCPFESKFNRSSNPDRISFEPQFESRSNCVYPFEFEFKCVFSFEMLGTIMTDFSLFNFKIKKYIKVITYFIIGKLLTIIINISLVKMLSSVAQVMEVFKRISFNSKVQDYIIVIIYRSYYYKIYRKQLYQPF